MLNTPLISVVIPAYNASSYVAQCIENIKYQSYKNIEIIIVSDGSNDSTEAIAESYGVKVISQSRQGVSAARNRGLDEATGDYIHFMDVDDLLNDKFYEEMLKTCLSHEADMVCCSVVQEWQSTNSLMYRHKLIAVNCEDKMELTDAGNLSYCWKFLIKSSFISKNKLRFDIAVSFFEDLLFLLPAVYLANKIVSVPNAVYIYKKRQTSTSNQFSKLNKRERRRRWGERNSFKHDFAIKHGLDTLGRSEYTLKRYRIFGIPLLKQKRFTSGAVRWYVFNVCVLQEKLID